MAGMRSQFIRCFFAALLALTMTFAVTPAKACGCGIYFPLEGEASVSEEHVLIRWDGQTEDIVMTLGVLGSSKEAAVVLPVPTRAEVRLADGELFDALQELTKPIVKKEIAFFPFIGGAEGTGAPGSVALLARQTLGPFDVSTLAATDADALGDWLAGNGYNLAPEVAAALEPYVEQNWYYIAVRLSPGANETDLSGSLDPLWITFDYDRIVYPMRLSALARDSLTVFMYILADHRVQKPMSFGYEDIQFADWVEPSSLGEDSPLAPFITEKLFLTKIVEQIYDPASIQNDYFFEFAASDETYHIVRYEYVYDIAGIPFFILIPGGVLLAVVVLGVFIAGKIRKK